MDRHPRWALLASLALGAIACVIPAPPTAAPAPRTAAPPAPVSDVRATATAPGSTGDPQHDPRRWFPFPPRDIDSPGGLVDLSALDAAPAGARGFIRPDGGHFVDGAGKRIRFFGVNCTATACFPTHEMAPRAAAHLARLGVNVVRLHFMDKGTAPIGLLSADRKGLDPAQLDRLDFFVAELAKHGIYVDLNLHVARRYEGLEGEAARRFDMGKMLDRFYPPFIQSQKDYARALLTHVNPYTQHAYASEPAVLCVEMNNENTALPFWSGNLDDLPEPYAGSLRRRWNVWLAARYRTTARLRAAWTVKRELIAEIYSQDLSAKTSGWTFESAGVPTRGEIVDTEDYGHALRFSADQRGTASWHLQFYQAHLPLDEGERYHVSFRVRAPQGGTSPAARALEVSAMLSVPDWRNIGLDRTIVLGPTWQKVDLSFRVTGTIAGEGRLNFSLRNLPGVVEIADLFLAAGAAPVALAADETVEKGTIPLVHGESGAPAGEDFLRFLADTDRATAQELAGFIRHDLRLKSMLVDTQASYGGLEGLRRELAVSDFVDMHAYWQHPDFPSGWSNLHFQIPNTTQVAAADGGALGSLAAYRVAGKPFTVSEYNVPTPNDYASEALPMYAAIAGVQDWDAIYAYTYLDFSSQWNADHLLGFFSLAGNPAATSFLPVAALAFRRGLVAPGSALGVLTLPNPGAGAQPLTEEGALARLWDHGARYPFGDTGPPRVASQRREILVGGSPGSSFDCDDNRSAHGKPRPSDDCLPMSVREVRWDASAPHPTFTVVAPALRMAAGAIAGRRVNLGDVDLTVGELPRGDASIALVALDGLPLEQSKRILLVAAARVENTGMAFDDARTGLTSWGRAPALAEYVPLTVTVPWPELRAERLDSAGNFAAEIPIPDAVRAPEPPPRSPAFSLVPSAQIIPPMSEPPADAKTLRRVIVAASLGTLFEWYDFYLYGALAVFFGGLFFPKTNDTAQLLSSLAAFGAGFGVRPLGALVFGYVGDLVGRKYTFLITMATMGLSTAVLGLLPTFDSVGLLATFLLVSLRLLQGLALGGEYGGAATYVAEHVPDEKRGYYTSVIQTTATLGFFLSMGVIGTCRFALGEAAFKSYGWRIPFLLSFLLLAVSLYIRVKMRESPLFTKLKASGKASLNPLKESFTNPVNLKYVLLALFGATAGQGVVWYTGQFYVLTFLQSTLKIAWSSAYIMVSVALLLTTPLFVVFGRLSDRIGRKKIMLSGALLAALTYLPIYIGLKTFSKPINWPVMILLLSVQMVYVCMIYGPIAAFLVELFPTKIRYTSMSLPYHLGNGWFGGFLPLIATAVTASAWSKRTFGGGAIYTGLIYPIAVCLLTVVVGGLFIHETKDHKIDA